MKKLFIIIIILICFQSLSKADDIRAFQIEGISIGDSLLEHFNLNEINDATDESAKDRISVSYTHLTLPTILLV